MRNINITWEDASFLCTIAAAIFALAYGALTRQLTKSNRIGLIGLTIGLVATSVLFTLVDHFFKITPDWMMTIFVMDGIFISSALIVLVPGKERFKARHAARTLGHRASKAAVVLVLWLITGWCTHTEQDRLVFAGTILFMFLVDYVSYKLIIHKVLPDKNPRIFNIKVH